MDFAGSILAFCSFFCLEEGIFSSAPCAKTALLLYMPTPSPLSSFPILALRPQPTPLASASPFPSPLLVAKFVLRLIDRVISEIEKKWSFLYLLWRLLFDFFSSFVSAASNFSLINNHSIFPSFPPFPFLSSPPSPTFPSPSPPPTSHPPFQHLNPPILINQPNPTQPNPLHIYQPKRNQCIFKTC